MLKKKIKYCGKNYEETVEYMIKEKFNDNWEFISKGEHPLDAAKENAGQNLITLPHDASIGMKRNPNEPNGSGNGFFHEEEYIYKKAFQMEEKDMDKIVTIEFEGVYQNAFIYVNNSFAGKHPYGYGNFYIDVTKYLKSGENIIKVIVKNGVPSGRWYTGGGIYRDVNIMKSNRLHVLPDGVHMTTIELEEDLAVIRSEVNIEYRGLGMREFQLHTELIGEAENVVSEDSMTITLSENESGTYRQRLDVAEPRTWDAEHPHLYGYRTEIVENGRVVDTETGTFGIRKLQLDSKHGLRVNGKSVKLRGGCIHHDHGIIGTMDFYHADEEQVLKLKKAGFNAIRSAHYPIGRHMLEACDKYGMYVMDEFSDVWTSCKVDYDYGMHMSEWWEYDLTNMVNKDYNHPCVIMYSIGNEIPETGDRFDKQLGKKLADKIRELDDNRYTIECMSLLLSMMNNLPVALAEMGADGEVQVGEINEMMTNLGDSLPRFMNCAFAGRLTDESSGQVDITGLNYASGRYLADARLHPNRIFVGSETYPPDLDVNWELVEQYPFILGDFDWTAWDYLGETGIGKVEYNKKRELSFYTPYPDKAAYCGDFNLIGDPRPIALWRETIWGISHGPYIAVCPPEHYSDTLSKTGWMMTDAVRSWNHKRYEGAPIKVEVYTDAEEVELFINGISVERKAVGEIKKNIAYFDTTYHSGIIEAIAYHEGIEVDRDFIKTASDNLVMDVIPDCKIIPADGSDICYIDLSLKDEEGNLNPEEVRDIAVSVSGTGYLLGYGSADPSSEENYFDTFVKTYEGRLRAAIRAKENGEVKATFSCEGMDSKTVTITAN